MLLFSFSFSFFLFEREKLWLNLLKELFWGMVYETLCLKVGSTLPFG
jgi:hypothetical protein